MRFFSVVGLTFALFTSSPTFAYMQSQSQATDTPSPTLADIARQYRQKNHSQGPSPAEVNRLVEGISTGAEKDNDLQQENASAGNSADFDGYQQQIRQMLVQKRFDLLEKAAQDARSSKGRFAGGIWQLYAFYDAIGSPVAHTQADWSTYLATLQEWLLKQPDSITAPVALARGYISYAWKARGGGFADTVTEDGSALMDERIEKAKEILVKARRLKTVCPFWYEAMQIVALAQGWDKSAARALLDEAIAFEPHYYHYYREYVNFLLPKWYGEEGEAEDFANEVAARVGGQEGAFLYFEMATVINCQCGSDEVHMAHMSWPRIKQGYAALKQLYGTTPIKENRYAYMAYLAKDKATARDIFAKIGPNWLPTVWKKRNDFEAARSWALNQ